MWLALLLDFFVFVILFRVWTIYQFIVTRDSQDVKEQTAIWSCKDDMKVPEFLNRKEYLLVLHEALVNNFD